jgi:hypothetical protein
VEPKQTETGQNEDQEEKKRQIRTKQRKKSETNRVKSKKVENCGWDCIFFSCFASKVVCFGLTETPKLTVSLFRETTETSLFILDSVKTSLSSLDLNRVS